MLRTHVHATEDREKVLEALKNVLPPSLRNSTEVKSEVYEGHYGNRIEVLSIEIRDPQLSTEVLLYILTSLKEHDRRLLLATLDERVDENGSFFIRIDKQSSYKGSLELSEGDDVIKVSFHIAGKRREIVKFLEEVLSR
ncbi:MAG: RNA-binding domain-containing protein [Acidilobaceae archaeon]